MVNINFSSLNIYIVSSNFILSHIECPRGHPYLVTEVGPLIKNLYTNNVY